MGTVGIRVKHRYLRRVGLVEVNRRHGVELSQPLPDGSCQYLPYRLLVFKLYFVFRRMDVYIYRLGGDLKTYEVLWLLVGGDKLLVALHHRLVEVWMAHVATVDHEILQCAAASGVFGARHKPVYLYKRRIRHYRYELSVERFAEEVDDALFECRFEQLVHDYVIVAELKFDTGIDQRQALELTQDVGHLHMVAFQEFASGRRIEEQSLYRHRRAGSCHCRLL